MKPKTYLHCFHENKLNLKPKEVCGGGGDVHGENHNGRSF